MQALVVHESYRRSAEPEIVLCVDDSATAPYAAAWAAAEAAARGGRLTIMHATGYAVDAPDTRRATDILDTAREVARREHPRLGIATRIVDGDLVHGLLDAAEDAQLVVLGLGSGATAGAVREPPAVDLLGRASCPVLLVRRLDVLSGSSVVACVDGSPVDTAVLSSAFAAAAAHRLPLRVIDVDPPRSYEPAELVAAELQCWSGPYPEVRATFEAVQGRPATVVAQRSAGARLLVVGIPRRRSRGAAVGSTDRLPALESRCPVLVAIGSDSGPPRRVNGYDTPWGAAPRGR
ncbi:universal stress protein family [Pseudonocardia sp. N23]|nr:universal stress protein family [Pseudonocardia sp. N23]